MQPEKKSSLKSIIIFVVIAVLALGAYLYMTGTPDDSSISSLSQADSVTSMAAQSEGSEVLVLLNQISSLRISTDIFENIVYKTLIDYTVEIPPQNVGRPNPFAPIGQ